jgi:hypothetical protein
MKLKAIHLFIILLGALLLCSSLGVFMRTEGFKNKDNKDSNDNESYFQEFKNAVESPFDEKNSDTKHSNTKQSDTKHSNTKQSDTKHSDTKHSDKLTHTKNSSTQEFINDLQSTTNNKKPKKHTDDNSDIYDYNSSKYKHKKKSSYIGPAGDTVITDSSHTDYPVKSYTHKKPKSTSLGIPYSQIPTGNEDLYILKSEVIPPVCPMCPSISACPSKEPPPPCPPCARCPEPAFDCKKVPNYNNTDSRYLPVPVLSDFSQFGM